MEGEFSVIADNTLRTLSTPLSKMQKDFLCLKAMGSSDIEARRMAEVAESTFRLWKENEAFMDSYNIVGTGGYRTEAIEMWLDNQLPVVFSELMNIVSSGKDGGRAHKDKERAIEFFLKELLGISKHVDKSMSVASMLIAIGKDLKED